MNYRIFISLLLLTTSTLTFAYTPEDIFRLEFPGKPYYLAEQYRGTNNQMFQNVITRFQQNGYGRNYRYYVLESNEWNAFATSGFTTPDIVCVLSGLLSTIPNEDALAGVIAHEIIHNDKRHGIKAQTNQLFVLGAILAISSRKKTIDSTKADIFANIVMNGFSRVDEYEADREGLFLMAKCGYNPDAVIQMWRGKMGDFRLLKVFMSHPLTSERVSQLEKHKQRIQYHPNGSITIARDFTDTLSPMEKRLYNASALATYTFGGYFLASAIDYDWDFSKISARNSFPDASYWALAGFAVGLIIPTDLAGTGAMFANKSGTLGVGFTRYGIGIVAKF